jgi:hypothetical protein
MAGPGGSASRPEKNLPTEWSPATKDKPAVNIGWVTEIPGRGHSSPIVGGNLIFVTTVDQRARKCPAARRRST